MGPMFTTVSVWSFERSVQQLSVTITLNVTSTEVGVLQRACGNRIGTCSLWIPFSEATHSRVFTMARLESHQWACVRKREGQSNDTVLSAWLQASWRDLAGSGSPQVPFQWAVITAEVSSHTLTHTHADTHTWSGARGMNERTEAWAWSSEQQPGVGVRKSSGGTIRAH